MKRDCLNKNEFKHNYFISRCGQFKGLKIEITSIHNCRMLILSSNIVG